MTEYGLKSGTIVTRIEAEQIEAGLAKIEVVPVCRFLLNIEDS